MKTIKLHRDDYTRFMTDVDGARHEIKKSLYDANGPCRIAGHSGRFLAIVRDDPGPAPGTVSEGAIDTTSEEVDQKQIDTDNASMKRMKNSGHLARVPSPKNCKCAQWPWDERPVDDRGRSAEHHRACAHKKAWDRQKGGHMKTVAAGPTFEARVFPAGAIRNHANPKPTFTGRPSHPVEKVRRKSETIPMPDKCPKCKDFTKSKRMAADQHHPTCVYFKKYLVLSAARANSAARTGTAVVVPKVAPPKNRTPVVLYDLETQQQVREAEPDEIEEARVALRDTSAPLITVDEKQYAVMYEDGESLEPAEPETDDLETSDTEPPSPIEVEDSEDDDAEEQAPAP